MSTDIINNDDIESLITNYINSLTTIERLVLEMAKRHLESSFCIEKSIGFIEWMKLNREREMERERENVST